MINLKMPGKNVLVCGSSAGIGKATAHVFAQMEANVILMARNQQKLQTVLASLTRVGNQKHHAIVADFFKPQEVEARIKAYLNDNPIHVLINNTGGPDTGPLLQKSSEDLLKFLNQHLICAHLLAQAIVPAMKTTGYGRIINIISNSAKQPLPNMGLSNTIRAAVANWAKTLSTELGTAGITVNNILPGTTDTKELDTIINDKANKQGKTRADIVQQMHALCPLRRFADPIEIAWAIGFIASPKATYINGINLVIDGGKTLSL